MVTAMVRCWRIVFSWYPNVYRFGFSLLELKLLSSKACFQWSFFSSSFLFVFVLFCWRPHSQPNIVLLPGRILWSSPALCTAEEKKNSLVLKRWNFLALFVTDVFHCFRYLKNSSRKLNLLSGLKLSSSWLIFWSSCFLHSSLALPFFGKLWNVRPLFCLILAVQFTTGQCVASHILKFERFHPNPSKHVRLLFCSILAVQFTTEQCVASPILKFKRFHPNLSKHALAQGSGSDCVHE